MKKLLFIIALTSSVTLTHAQTLLGDFQKKYQHREGVNSVTISGDLFKISSTILKYSGDKDSEALSRICSGINSMYVLNMEERYFDHIDDELRILKSDLSKSNLNLLMTVKERTETVEVYSEMKNEEVVNGIVLFIRKDREFTLLEIKGTIHMKDLSVLTENHSTWH